MTKDKDAPENFSVVDKRRFTPAGELRPDAEPSPPQPSQSQPAAETPPAPAPQPKASPPPESEHARETRQAYERQARNAPGQRIDFETVVLSISTSAMYQLGLVQDQAGRTLPADPDAARHTIDMLGVLQEKTQGNLSFQEQQLLDQVLYELRMAYLQVTGGVRPAAAPPPKAGR
jgi:hypothetical protein